MRVRGTIRDQCVSDRSNGRDTNLHEWRPRARAIVTRARHDPSVRGHTQAVLAPNWHMTIRQRTPGHKLLHHSSEATRILGWQEVTTPLQTHKASAGNVRGRSLTNGSREERIAVSPHHGARDLDPTEGGVYWPVEARQVAKARLEETPRRRDALRKP